jgi:lipid A disaccharide synthetase
MVNLIADRPVVTELIQHDMTAPRIAEAAANLLENPAETDTMRVGLASVRRSLETDRDPFAHTAELIADFCNLRFGASAPATVVSGRE